MILAPVSPSGWPSTQAPPKKFTCFSESFNSLMAAIGTTANASLISYKSISFVVNPVFSSTPLMAPMGAVVNQAGSWAKIQCPKILAIGLIPLFSASDWRMIISAEAPSEI